MTVSTINPLDAHDLTPLDRCRAEALLRVLSRPMSLDQSWMKELKELTGFTSSQFDKSLNLLIESGLATVEPGIGCVIVEPTGAGQELRETLR